MVDFAAAVHEGIEAAHRADFAQREIDSVFDRLKNDVQQASRGTVLIKRERLIEGSPGEGPVEWSSRSSRTGETGYWAIVAKRAMVKGARIYELARWEQDPRGYPCKVTWPGLVSYCEDREGLEKCLANLLREPIVGKVIDTIMSGESQPQTIPAVANEEST